MQYSGRTALPLLLVLLSVAGQAMFAQANTALPDTLNKLDEQGRKQGWWRIQAPLADKPGYGVGELVEEGRYRDNKRTGQWVRYWPNGKRMSEVNYLAGLPKGKYSLYYDTGILEEQGTWDLDRNTGAFKRWHPNGSVAQDFKFDSFGTRDGEQKYFHENGKLAVDVQVVQGKEEGTLKRYSANGELQETVRFDGGEAEAGSFRTYRPKAAVEQPTPAAPAAPARTAQESTNTMDFRAEGYNTLYDSQHRLTQQGQYHKGRLWQGKVYKYNRNGILYKIEVYVEGRYIGNAQFTEDDR